MGGGEGERERECLLMCVYMCVCMGGRGALCGGVLLCVCLALSVVVIVK